MINTQRFVNRMGSLTGNMGACCRHAANGASKVGLTRSEIIANKHRAEKAATSRASIARLKEKLFPVRSLGRIAAVKQIGTHNFRVLAGCHIPANAEISRGELKAALRAHRFTGFRFTNGKRVLAIA